MRKIKRIIAFALAMIMGFGSYAIAYGATTVVTQNTTWNMKDHGATTAEITSPVEWKNLTINATTAKPVKFDANYLNLGGAGNTEYRSVAFKVAGPATIKITAKGGTIDNADGTTSSRILTVVDSKGTEIGNMEAPGTENTATIDYKGLGDTIYMYSKGKGISIKSITLTYKATNNRKGDVNGDGKVNALDAVLVLKHLSNLSILTGDAALAAANGNNDETIDLRDASWILSNVYEPTSETTTIATIDTSDGKKVTNYNELVSAVGTAGAKIYVMNDIEMGDRLRLQKGNISLIGVPDAEGKLPTLNFENMKGSGRDLNANSSTDSDAGININSANNTVKNLIIEKARDNGIQIKGTGAVGNTIENCVVRYNNDSGIQVTGGACKTTLRNIYSYRNCDVYTLGGNADGFAIKLSAGPVKTTDSTIMNDNKTVCENCYAWENGDDAWDSFDYPLNEQSTDFQTAGGRWTYRIDYTNCMCWNNGIPENCLGYTDYIKGAKLDENLPIIRRYKSLYPAKYDAFVTAYNNGTLCSRTASASTYYSKLDSTFDTIGTTKGALNATNIAKSTNWAGNPNGFKLGSAYTQSNSERYMKNCIAFDHKANGFDKNNSGAKIWLENGISFGNNINYHLANYTANKWTKAYGWSGTKSDNKPTAGSGVTVSIGSSKSGEEQTIRDAADRLAGFAANNTFVPSNVFDTVFK